MSNKTKHKKKITFGIMQKILAIAFVPLLSLAVIIAAFSAKTIRTGMQDEAVARLRDITIGVEQLLLAADEGDFHLEANGMYRGQHNIADNLPAFEAFCAATNIEITVCWGDTRMVTTLKEESTGNSLAGSKVSEQVSQKVLKDGVEYVDKDIVINGEPFFCCYIPLKNNDGTIVGMIFAGEHGSGIEDYIDHELWQTTGINVAVILLSSAVILYFSWTLSKAVRKEEEIIEKLAEGSLNLEVDEKLLRRRDELGSIARALYNLIHSLSEIISHIQESADHLMHSGQSLDEMAERVNANAAEINKAVEDISAGAVTQAEEIEMASGQIVDMGNVIENIVSDVDKLNVASGNMKQAGDTSAVIMQDLVSSTARANEAIRRIGSQIYATNESAQKIRAAVDIITSIASETSLLSLNASIEAARAGEFGKGFAVVASEIQKLAEESSTSAQTITDVINSLLADSEMTVKIMLEAEEIIKEQKEKLDATQSNFADVAAGISSSREDASMIEKRTRVCDSSRKTVVDVISNLSALSQENAASAQETTASMEELNATIQLLADAANSLRGISDQMEEEMGFFKL